MAKKKRRVARKRRPNPQATEQTSATEEAEAPSAEESQGETEETPASDEPAEPAPESGETEVAPEEGATEAVEVDAAEADGGETDASEAPTDGAEDEAESAGGEGEADSGPGLMGVGVEVDESEVEDTEHFLKGLVEALLFSSDKPQTVKEVARAAKIDKGRAQELIEQLLIDTKDRGVRLVEVSEAYAFRTNPAYSAYVRDFLAQRPVRLSRAQLETLAIIAYRQPITRPEVDDIRGVDSGAVMKLLLERELIRILGKKDEPGRPMIYGTAPAFLDLFSLNSLRDLPTLREFTELSEDSRAKFELEIGEPAPEGPIEIEEESSEESEGSSEETEGAEGAVADGAGEQEAASEDVEGGEPETTEAEGERSENADVAPDGPASEGSEDDEPSDSESGAAAEPSEEPSSDDVPLNEADEEEFPDDEDDEDDDDDDEDED